MISHFFTAPFYLGIFPFVGEGSWPACGASSNSHQRISAPWAAWVTKRKAPRFEPVSRFRSRVFRTPIAEELLKHPNLPSLEGRGTAIAVRSELQSQQRT